jgi:hypothetical protein
MGRHSQPNCAVFATSGALIAAEERTFLFGSCLTFQPFEWHT